MLKDAKGESTLLDKIAIEIDGLLKYNNADYVPTTEVYDTATKIMHLVIKSNQND